MSVKEKLVIEITTEWPTGLAAGKYQCDSHDVLVGLYHGTGTSRREVEYQHVKAGESFDVEATANGHWIGAEVFTGNPPDSDEVTANLEDLTPGRSSKTVSKPIELRRSVPYQRSETLGYFRNESTAIAFARGSDRGNYELVEADTGELILKFRV